MRAFFLLLGVLVGLLAVTRVTTAQSDPLRSPAPDAYRLANGLRVVLAPDSVIKDVHVVVRYEVGHAHDPPSYRGLAHLLEHLTFRGSRHLLPLQAGALLDELGASFNAFTDTETTQYLTAAPTRALETILWIESERMGFALDGIDERALRLEQSIVANELGQRERGLGVMVYGEQLRALYGKAHPFTPSRDEAEDVAAVALNGLRWFFQSTYRPANATLVVVGRFDAETARRSIEQYFGPLKNPRLPLRDVPRPAPVLCGVRHVEVGHPFLLGRRMAFSWPLPVRPSPEARVELDVVVAVLKSRLHDLLVKRAFKASYVSVGITDFETHALLDVDVAVHDDADWPFVETAVRREAQVLSSELLTEAELQALRVNARSRHVFSRSRGIGLALLLAEGRQPEAEHAALDTLRASAVMAAARPLLGPHLVLRAAPSRRAYDEAIVLDQDGACP